MVVVVERPIEFSSCGGVTGCGDLVLCSWIHEAVEVYESLEWIIVRRMAYVWDDYSWVHL